MGYCIDRPDKIEWACGSYNTGSRSRVAYAYRDYSLFIEQSINLGNIFAPFITRNLTVNRSIHNLTLVLQSDQK